MGGLEGVELTCMPERIDRPSSAPKPTTDITTYAHAKQYLDAKMEELLAAARSVFPSWLGGGGGASSSSSLLDRLQRRSK